MMYSWRHAYHQGKLDLGPGTQTPAGGLTMNEALIFSRKLALFSQHAVGSRQRRENGVNC